MDEALIRFKNIISVPNNDDLKRFIMKEFHVKPYFSHPGYQKSLTTIKKFYYWPNLKKEVVDFVAKRTES